MGDALQGCGSRHDLQIKPYVQWLAGAGFFLKEKPQKIRRAWFFAYNLFSKGNTKSLFTRMAVSRISHCI